MRRVAYIAGLLGLVVITGLAYIPVYRADFIWDDNLYVMPIDEMRTLEGLRRIWTDTQAFKQYYPLCYTTFWIENQFWRLNPEGYHAVNVALHVANALLFWAVLRRLGLRGAWVVAAIFALHPVHVESVAWITERRNVLSAFFYLLTILAYLRFCGLRASPSQNNLSRTAPAAFRWPAYGVALVTFVAALLSKTVTCTLPAALLLMLWWRRPRLTWRDILPVVPFFILGAGLSLVTWNIESKYVGSALLESHYTPVDRLLIAGRALWFYLGKLLLPLNLVHVYPRWTIDDLHAAGSYLYPVAAAALVVVLWRFRQRIGKGPLAAFLFYAGTLAPTLGLVNFGYMDLSLVADRFQYLPSLGIIALVVGLISAVATRLGRAGVKSASVVTVLALVLLGVGVWRRSQIFTNSLTLWEATLTANPDCPTGHYNLATDLVDAGRPAEAIPHLEAAVRLRPTYFLALSDLGAAYLDRGRLSEALTTLRRAEQLRPNDALVHYNLGLAFERLRQIDEAIGQYRRALECDPAYQPARDSLNAALRARSRIPPR